MIFKIILFMCFGCAGSSLLHGLVSGCRERGLLCSCGVQAAECGGFSLRVQAPGHAGFSSWSSDSRAQAQQC